MSTGNRSSLQWTRREFLETSSLALVGLTLRQKSPQVCTLIPEQEEGPYYIDYEKFRRDLTEGKPGVPVQLKLSVFDSKRCVPIENVALDIWHCDPMGVYSGFTASSGSEGGPPPRGGGPGGRGGPRGSSAVTDTTRFLRGVQMTDKQGIATFDTLYPGWYPGRTIHIHLKAHLDGAATGERYAGGHVAHTGQLFFPEEISERIAKLEPYAGHSAVHRTLHSEDNVFRSQGGEQAMLTVTRRAPGSDPAGFLAEIALALDPSATPEVF